jgi:Ras GTPase-activating-like protein IQGAP2/3
LLYVLRVQTGANLLDILVSPVIPEHEEKYKAILREERIDRSKKKAIAYSESALGDLSKITYRELKLLGLEKVLELESFGKITRESNYQEILNYIALDIRTKRNRRLSRQKEMSSIKQNLSHLAEKEAYLQTQLTTYNNYIEQAMSTLQTKKGKRRALVLPFTKQYFHMRDLQKTGRVPKFGSYKYTASNLYDKGVLVELNGYNERQYSQVSFTFSSDQVGVFNIEAAYGSIALPGATVELTLDDLLGQQYNNRQYIQLFDDMVKLNTNLTLHFIFKKFYGEA